MKARALIAALLLVPVIAGAAALWPRPAVMPDPPEATSTECNSCTARHQNILRKQAQP